MTIAEPTWRDYAEQLTDEQIRELEYTEAESGPGRVFPTADPEVLIRMARGRIEENEAQRRYADIPAPVDAIDTPSRWTDYDATRWWRTYISHHQALDYPLPEYPNHDGTVTIEVVGYQYSDGNVERQIRIDGGGLELLTADQAREVARALLAAAEKIDIADGTSPPFM